MADQKMVYPEMEQMASVFGNVANELDEMKAMMNYIASLLADGGLIGDAGNELADALTTKLNPSLSRLQDKMLELQGDIKGAVEFMRDGVSDARSRFL